MATPEPDSDLVKGMVPDLRRLAPNLVVAGILPIVGYALLRPHVGSDTVALAAVLVFPVAETLFERAHRGHFEPIGVIAMIGIAVGLVGALVSRGSPLMLKVRESALTGAFGLLCLVSLGGRRPAMFYLGRAFAAGGDATKRDAFDELWDLPDVAHRFRVVTIVWGVALVAEAAFRTALALTLPTQTFLVIAQVVNWAVLGGLLWFTVAYRRAGERRVTALLEAEAMNEPVATT